MLFLFQLIQVNFTHIVLSLGQKKFQSQKETMSSPVYKVTEIGGKGLGCVAISDIKKGSLILMENPQLCFETEEKMGSSMMIKSLLKSFYEMSKADQNEYMTLHNKYNNIQSFQNSVDIPNFKEILDKKIEEIEAVKFEIGKIEQDPEKAKEILKIIGIFTTNCYKHGVYFKWSRFNHSCQPNTAIFDTNGQLQLRAIGNIKAGKEINITYLDVFSGFRNRKHRQQYLFTGWNFVCSCDLCENVVDIDAETFEAFIQEAEKLNIKHQSAINAGILLEATRSYSLESCKKEIVCYKQLYKVGKDKNIQPYFLWKMLDKGFQAATTGYQLYKATFLKNDAMTFAKAAEQFGKILGNEIITYGNSFSYQQTYQDLIDKAGY